MCGSNRLGIKGAIASLIAVGALCTGSFAQNENCPNPKGGNCFEATPMIPGCQEEACCNIVCDIVPDCCSVEWDQFCADFALEACVCDVCGLPHGMSGQDIAREARRRRPDLKVVFTSGYPATGDGDILEVDESTEFVRKPYRKSELAEKLAAVLNI